MEMRFKDFGLGATCLSCEGSGKAVDHADIGKWVKGYRERQQRTLAQVASATGLSISHICDLEHGRRSWKESKFERIVGAIKGESKWKNDTQTVIERVNALPDDLLCGDCQLASGDLKLLVAEIARYEAMLADVRRIHLFKLGVLTTNASHQWLTTVDGKLRAFDTALDAYKALKGT